MAVRTARPRFERMEDLLKALDGIPACRIRLSPPPGQATEKDLIRLQKHGRLYELVEGTLVEKPVGLDEAFLNLELCYHLMIYLALNPLGRLAGADAMLRVIPEAVRLPDISFLTNEQIAEHERTGKAIGPFAPALAVEILSPSNTKKEMARKRQEYFLGGTQLVWIVNPIKRTVTVWTSPENSTTLTEEDTLDGGTLLPGFTLPLRVLFAKTPKKVRRGKK